MSSQPLELGAALELLDRRVARARRAWAGAEAAEAAERGSARHADVCRRLGEARVRFEEALRGGTGQLTQERVSVLHARQERTAAAWARAERAEGAARRGWRPGDAAWAARHDAACARTDRARAAHEAARRAWLEVGCDWMAQEMARECTEGRR